MSKPIPLPPQFTNPYEIELNKVIARYKSLNKRVYTKDEWKKLSAEYRKECDSLWKKRENYSNENKEFVKFEYVCKKCNTSTCGHFKRAIALRKLIPWAFKK